LKFFNGRKAIRSGQLFVCRIRSEEVRDAEVGTSDKGPTGAAIQAVFIIAPIAFIVVQEAVVARSIIH
jgi:hypothetical protein